MSQGVEHKPYITLSQAHIWLRRFGAYSVDFRKWNPVREQYETYEAYAVAYLSDGDAKRGARKIGKREGLEYDNRINGHKV